MKKQTKYTNHPDFPKIEDVQIMEDILEPIDFQVDQKKTTYIKQKKDSNHSNTLQVQDKT